MDRLNAYTNMAQFSGVDSPVINETTYESFEKEIFTPLLFFSCIPFSKIPFPQIAYPAIFFIESVAAEALQWFGIAQMGFSSGIILREVVNRELINHKWVKDDGRGAQREVAMQKHRVYIVHGGVNFLKGYLKMNFIARILLALGQFLSMFVRNPFSSSGSASLRLGYSCEKGRNTPRESFIKLRSVANTFSQLSFIQGINPILEKEEFSAISSVISGFLDRVETFLPDTEKVNKGEAVDPVVISEKDLVFFERKMLNFLSYIPFVKGLPGYDMNIPLLGVSPRHAQLIFGVFLMTLAAKELQEELFFHLKDVAFQILSKVVPNVQYKGLLRDPSDQEDQARVERYKTYFHHGALNVIRWVVKRALSENIYTAVAGLALFVSYDLILTSRIKYPVEMKKD